MKKVAIISTGHPPFDERIFDKLSKSFKKMEKSVFIIVTTQDIDQEVDGILIQGKNLRNNYSNQLQKFRFILAKLEMISPDLILACEPIPVIIAFIHKLLNRSKTQLKIIYDVTEWYPENIYLKRKGINKFFTLITGHLINFIATNLCDYLYVGEETKLMRYRFYSPKKRYSIISYYPVLDFYKPSTKSILNKEVIFGFAGVISTSRGLDIFYEILKSLKETLPDYELGFILVGRFELENEKIYLEKFKNLGIRFEYYEWTDYKNFSRLLENVHICLDIRPPNKIYEHSLPIKIFDYMAIGKCIVASNYEPIRRIFEIADCGILVNPNDINSIVREIIELLKEGEKIVKYGINGRKAVERFFNWTVCEEEIKRSLKILNLQ